MNRKILYSPIGGTDPISNTNCHDGSMLHICRHYKPDVLYLYMSKEMADYQDADQRITWCLDQLKKRVGIEYDVNLIRRDNLTVVQDFDFFYEEFRGELIKIKENMDSTDELIINISSGTPAMKSGLFVMAILGEIKCTLVQVVTPEGGINEHKHKDYDVKLLWELDPDNEEGAENRCREVESPSLIQIKYREMLIRLLNSYDYSAAYNLTKEEIDESISMPFIYEIEAIKHCAMQEYNQFRSMKEKTKVSEILPRMDNSDRQVFIYALATDLKLRRHEYSDFVRALTPLIVTLFERILKYRCNIDINDYCRYEGNKRKWDSDKLKGKQIDQILNKKFKDDFRYGAVYSVALSAIISGLSNDTGLSDNCSKLRKVEEEIRNIAAHEMVEINENQIKHITGFTSDQITEMLRRAFTDAGFKVSKDDWDFFNNGNAQIIRIIKEGL